MPPEAVHRGVLGRTTGCVAAVGSRGSGCLVGYQGVIEAMPSWSNAVATLGLSPAGSSAAISRPAL